MVWKRGVKRGRRERSRMLWAMRKRRRRVHVALLGERSERSDLLGARTRLDVPAQFGFLCINSLYTYIDIGRVIIYSLEPHPLPPIPFLLQGDLLGGGKEKSATAASLFESPRLYHMTQNVQSTNAVKFDACIC